MHAAREVDGQTSKADMRTYIRTTNVHTHLHADMRMQMRMHKHI